MKVRMGIEVVTSPGGRNRAVRFGRDVHETGLVKAYMGSGGSGV